MRAENSKYLLKEGDIIELKSGHEVYADVPEHFLYYNRKGNFRLAHGHALIKGELNYLAGRYVVCHSAEDGGGGSDRDGPCPGGHHVFCERLGPPYNRVDFYQTGGFSAKIDDITPVGKAERKWVEP